MHGFNTGLRGIRTLAKYFLEKEKKLQGTIKGMFVCLHW